jgi:transcriptional regulator with XRE-family HTH domain
VSGPSPSAAQLGRLIRRLRKQRNLTIEELAGEAGIHTTYLSAIERGLRNPSWNVVGAIAEALEMDISELARLTEERNRRNRGRA